MKSAMKPIKIILLISILFSLPVLSAAEQGEKGTEAIKAAKIFLKLVDGGQYHESWAKTAPLFKGQVSQAKWAEMLAGVRPPFGAIVSRAV